MVLLLACAGARLGLVAAQVASFQGGGEGWHLGTIAIGRLDGAADMKILVPYRDGAGNWFLDAFSYSGNRVPGFPYSAGGDPINTSPTICDLDRV